MTRKIIPLKNRAIEREKIAERIIGARAPSTWKRYQAALERLKAWATRERQDITVPIAPEVVAGWISSLADEGMSASSVRISAAAVTAIHVTAGYDSPTAHPQVSQLVRGVVRELRSAWPIHEADPLLPADLAEMVDGVLTDRRYTNRGLKAARDIALLLFGWAGGFRRSELAQLELKHLSFDDEGGVIVRLENTKTRVGEPHERRILRSDSHLCPVLALEEWLEASGIEDGLVFRTFNRGGKLTERPLSGSLIDSIVRQLARYLTAPKGRKPRYSAHSLRAGLATTAALAGKADRDIADHLGQRSLTTTARYVRTAKVRRSELTKGLL